MEFSITCMLKYLGEWVLSQTYFYQKYITKIV